MPETNSDSKSNNQIISPRGSLLAHQTGDKFLSDEFLELLHQLVEGQYQSNQGGAADYSGTQNQQGVSLFRLLMRGLFRFLVPSLYKPLNGIFKIVYAVKFAAVNSVNYAVFYVVAHYKLADVCYGGSDGGKLYQHVAAVTVFLDHPLDRFQVAYGARNAIDDNFLILRGMHVMILVVAHGTFSSSLSKTWGQLNVFRKRCFIVILASHLSILFCHPLDSPVCPGVFLRLNAKTTKADDTEFFGFINLRG
jgi:hypothetical protein